MRSMSSPSLFAAFEPQLQQDLRNIGVIRRFSDGQVIQQRGDETKGFYIIEKGRVKLGRFTSDGKFNMTIILGPGDSFGEIAVIGKFPRVADAIADGATELILVNSAALYAALVADPVSTQRVLQFMARQMQEALNAIVLQRRLTSEQQLARLIASMCRKKDMPAVLSINQADLAEHLGLSRMTIAKILAKLEKEELIRRGYGQITVYDSQALRHYS